MTNSTETQPEAPRLSDRLIWAVASLLNVITDPESGTCESSISRSGIRQAAPGTYARQIWAIARKELGDDFDAVVANTKNFDAKTLERIARGGTVTIERFVHHAKTGEMLNHKPSRSAYARG